MFRTILTRRRGTAAPALVACLLALALGAVTSVRSAKADACFAVCQLQGASSAVPGSHMAVVSRTQNHEEMFWVAPDGSVQDMYTYGGGTWGSFTLAPAGSAATCAGYNITAVSRAPNTMEVFWIGSDGSVQDASYYDGTGWSGLGGNPPLPVIAPAGSAQMYPGWCPGGVASVSRSPDRLEVVWVDQYMSIQDASWLQGFAWQRHSPLSGTHSVIQWTGATVALASRTKNTVELFFIDSSWYVYHASFVDGSDWSAPSYIGGGHGSVAALSRASDTVEAFWLGNDGSIQDWWWYAETGQGGEADRTGPNAVALNEDPNLAYRPLGTSLSAVAPEPRTGRSMMVFFTAGDGSIQVLEWFQGAGPWRQYTAAIPGSNTAAFSYSNSIAAVHFAANDTVDVFWIDADGSIQHSYW